MKKLAPHSVVSVYTRTVARTLRRRIWESAKNLTTPKTRPHSRFTASLHEVISEMEIDQRLPPTYDGEERTLAHAYHAMAPVASERHGALLDAAAQLRRVLTTSVCEPMLRAFALLLGLDERALLSRCAGMRSDNTSLLRLLEYPRRTADSDDVGEWGITEHSDSSCSPCFTKTRLGSRSKIRTVCGTRQTAQGVEVGSSSRAICLGGYHRRISLTPHCVRGLILGAEEAHAPLCSSKRWMSWRRRSLQPRARRTLGHWRYRQVARPRGNAAGGAQQRSDGASSHVVFQGSAWAAA